MTYSNAGALSPVQARLIDEKIDDGAPNKGKFSGMNSGDGVTSSALIANSCITSGVYNLSEDFTCRTVYYFK